MAVAFQRGQQLGREDLNLFLDNASGYPTNAAEIYYAIYDFTQGQEGLVGSPQRIPANPAVGEYFASIVIPLDANVGIYRIRWSFRETVNGPLQQVVQEFEVVDKGKVFETQNTAIVTDMIRRLRIMLRDNCVGEEEMIELDVEGERLVLTIRDLYEALHGTP